VGNPSQSSQATPARETPDLNPASAAVPVRRDPPLSSALPVVVPLVGLGLVLLLAASDVSARRVPWPALAERLYANRLDLAAVGFGVIAIALALLWLNVTVLS
jgi:ABC-type antimicrobial peptide transport system permease subunit